MIVRTFTGKQVYRAAPWWHRRANHGTWPADKNNIAGIPNDEGERA
jgi:hypothetical protein